MLIEWLSYSEPWCLSRQLLWGHKIPAYFDIDTKKFIFLFFYKNKNILKLDRRYI